MPVQRYEAGISPYGLFQMAGNVGEWVADWYGGNYYESSPLRNPAGPECRIISSVAWRVVVGLAEVSSHLWAIQTASGDS